VSQRVSWPCAYLLLKRRLKRHCHIGDVAGHWTQLNQTCCLHQMSNCQQRFMIYWCLPPGFRFTVDKIVTKWVSFFIYKPVDELARVLYCHGKSSVRMSVHMTLRYHDHRGWKSSKIIARLVIAWGVRSLQSTTSRIYSKVNSEHSDILTGIVVGMEKVALGVQKL